MNLQSLLVSLAQKLLLLAMDQGFQRALPFIYRRLDAELPDWLQHANHPHGVDLAIKDAAAAVLNRDPRPHELQLIQLLYDPALAVVNAAAPRRNR